MSFLVLVLVLSLSYLVGDLSHFFAVDALFNEFILGFIIPMYIYFISTKSVVMKGLTALLMTVNIVIHAWAIASRVKII